MKRILTFLLLLIFGTGMKVEKELQITENQLEIINRKNGILQGLQFPRLEFQPPEVRIESLTPYETLYIYEDPSLPLVSLQILIEGGIEKQPYEEPVLYPLFVELWQEGGANGKSPEEVARQFADLGADVEFSIHQEFLAIEMSVLKENFPAAFSLLQELLTKPDFREEQLQILKAKYIDTIKRRNDRPEQIASRKIRELLEYPRKITESAGIEEVERVQRDDIVRVYRDILSQRRMHIGIDGDISGIPVREYFRQLSLELGKVEKPYVLKNEATGTGGFPKWKDSIILVEKNVPQAVIIVGTRIPSYVDPVSFSLRVSNYILGGGSFVSRMMREIRVKRGLAYYAYSTVRFSLTSGRFLATTGTNVHQAAESLKIMLELVENFPAIVRNDDVTVAKEAITNSHVFEFANPSRYLRSLMLEKIYQTQEEYFLKLPEKIQNLTPEQIVRDFQKHIRKEDLWIVVVGPKELEKSLGNFRRKVITVDPDKVLTEL